MKKQFSLFAALFIFRLLSAQEILLTIDDRQITKDEFLRIYNKNSSITSEDKKSVDEYMELFINYKLKVIEAENLGYDTMSSFIKEMAGYTKQLAKPYLDNSDKLDSFIYEAYQRSLEEVNASHILLKLYKSALPKDTARVYNRLMEIRNRIVNGESWDQVIIDESPDPENLIGGDLGWFSVFRMVYPFESAVYNTPVGEISMPVRTEYGYHLVKVNGRRQNRGEVLASHILAMIPQNPTDLEIEAAKKKIDEAYAELQKGIPWDSVVIKYSEHRATAMKGGRIGWIKSGNAPDDILDACFSLREGMYSLPVKSQYGYHIVRSDAFRFISEYETDRTNFEKTVKQTSYIRDIMSGQVLNRIKDEYGFEFFENNLEELYQFADSNLYTGTWNPEVAKNMLKPVFSIGDSLYTQYDIAKYIATTRHYKRGRDITIGIRTKVMDYTDECVLNYEIAQLPQKYLDYRYILEEYHDGILLFNLTEDMVWRKAVEDSIGLEKFYNELPEKYQWEPRIALTKYSYTDSTLTKALIKVAGSRIKKGMTAQDISDRLCPGDSIYCISFVELKYEKGDNAIADSIPWKTKTHLVTRDKDNFVLYYVDALLPQQTKLLSDARGLYTADYQSYLEKLWIDDLRAKYAITVNEDLLNEIKKEEESVTEP